MTSERLKNIEEHGGTKLSCRRETSEEKVRTKMISPFLSSGQTQLWVQMWTGYHFMAFMVPVFSNVVRRLSRWREEQFYYSIRRLNLLMIENNHLQKALSIYIDTTRRDGRQLLCTIERDH